MCYVQLPYRVHSHDGIGEKNWVVLNVCTTEVKKP